MFTIRECAETAGVTDLFKTTLLTGKTSEIFEVLNYPELLDLWNNYFRGRNPKEVSKEHSGNNEQWRDIDEQILFYIVLLSRDRYNKVFWNILGRVYQKSNFSERDKLAFVCYLHQCKFSNSRKDYRFLQAFCGDKGFWVESHYAALMSITQEDSTPEQIRGYVRFFCNNANKLMDDPIINDFETDKLVRDIKFFLEPHIENLSHVDKYFTLGIFKELEGDIAGAFEMHKKGYRVHKNPKILLKWLYNVNQLDKWEKFWKEETLNGIRDSEQYISVIYDLLLFAKTLNDDIEKQISDFATSYPKPPSWRELNNFYSGVISLNILGKILPAFELMYKLYPTDIAVCDVYARALFDLGKSEECISIREHILNYCKFSDEKYIDYCFKIILLCLMLDKKEKVYQYIKKIDNAGRKLSQRRSIYGLNLYKKRIAWLLDLYEKINDTGDEKAKLAYLDFCSAMDQQGLYGILICLCEQENIMLLDFDETIRIIKSSQDFEVNKFLIGIYLKSMTNRKDLRQGLIKLTEKINPILSRCFPKDLPIEMLEKVYKTISNAAISVTRQRCISLLESIDDEVLQKNLLSYMLGIYDYKTLIKGVMKSQIISSYRKAELRFEVYSLCLNAYNDNIIFYYLCAESLMDIGDYEKAREYFRYVAEYKDTIPKQDTSRIMMYVCDIFIKTHMHEPVDLSTEKDLSYKVAAIRRIIITSEYERKYLDKIYSIHNELNHPGVYIINSFMQKKAGNEIEALRHLQNIKNDTILYEICMENLNHISPMAVDYRNNLKSDDTTAYQKGYQSGTNRVQSQDILDKEIGDVLRNKVSDKDKATINNPDTNNAITNIVDDKDIKIEAKSLELPAHNISNNQTILNNIDKPRYDEKTTNIFNAYSSLEQWEGIDDFSHLLPNLHHALLQCPDRAEGDRMAYFRAIETSAHNMQKVIEVQKLTDKSKVLLEASKQAYLLNLNVDFFLLFNEYAYSMIADFDYKKEIERKLIFSYEFLVLLHAETKTGFSIPETYVDFAFRSMIEAYISLDTPEKLFDNLKYLYKAIELFQVFSYKYIPKISRAYSDVYDEVFGVIKEFIIKVQHYNEATEIDKKKEMLSQLSLNTVDFNYVIASKVNNPYKVLLIQFISSVDGLLAKENRNLIKMPDIKIVLLNVDKILKSDEALQFEIINEGEARALNVTSSFKILKDDLVVLSKDFTFDVVREMEKLPIRIDTGLTKEGLYHVSVHVRTGNDEKHTISYNDSFEIVLRSDEKFEFIPDKFVVSPIIDQKGFFGRKDIINTIENGLSGGVGNTTFIIYGLRRIGKSSLLYHIQNKFDNEFITVFCDGESHPANDTAELVYSMFVVQIHHEMVEHGIDINMPDFAEFERNPLLRLTSFFREVERKLKDKSLLLLIDEFELIILGVQEGKYSQDLFKTIRSQMQHSQKTKIVIAGGGYLLNMLVNEALSISDTSQPVKISFHQKSEIFEMVQKPYEGVLHYLPDSLERIFMLTNGHAYYASILCKELIGILNKEKRYVVYPSDIDLAAKIALEVNQYGNYENMWESLSGVTEKLVLAATAEELDHYDDYITMKKLYEKAEDIEAKYDLDGLLYKTRVSAAVNNMLKISILSEKSSGFRVSLELWRRWLQKAWPVQRVIEVYSDEIKTEMQKEANILEQ